MLIFLIGLGLGTFAGANIPDGVACVRGNLFCTGLRFRHPKLVF
ncbi:hypothetical protein ABN584_25295 [Gloeocapsa sp. BRSZ]